MTHLEEQGETYFEHMRHAAHLGLLLLVIGFKCIVHAIIPDLCTKAVSSKLNEINAKVNRNETPT
tara:strand:- start:2 stop:196 length:195 start_codon:yes stop_codon:yes gene_type:complete